MVVRLVILIAACALDVGMTARNLKTGREVNYLSARLIASVGVWPTLIGTKVAIVAAAVLIGQAGFYDVAAALNVAAAVYGFLHRAKS